MSAEYQAGKFTIHVSGCLCPPGPKRNHMCVHGVSKWIWLEGPGGFWRADCSPYKARQILSLCDSWDDVLLMADELRLEPPRETHSG